MGQLEATATIKWKGFGGTVEGASGRLQASTATQVELGGPGTGTNPEELLAAAHANCFASTLTGLARSRKVELESLVTTATTRLEWGEHAGHHLASSNLTVRVRSSSPEAEVRKLVLEAEQDCPVCQAIRGNVTMTVDFEYEPVSGAAIQ